jgi:hypothetical protein
MDVMSSAADRHFGRFHCVHISVLCTYFKTTAMNSYYKILLHKNSYEAFGHISATIEDRHSKCVANPSDPPKPLYERV